MRRKIGRACAAWLSREPAAQVARVWRPSRRTSKTAGRDRCRATRPSMTATAAPGRQGEEELAPILESVRALCADFPGSYWRALDRERAYPTAFVRAMTEAGFLGALIPESYGGSGLPLATAAAILEEVQARACNGAALHAQMYTMGTLLRHGSEEQKGRWLPGIAAGSLRLQAFGVTEPTAGTDTTSIRTTAVRDGDH